MFVYIFLNKIKITKEGFTIYPNINNKLNFKKTDLKTIYLAGGCFWGVEAYISRIFGVSNTTVGYANGKTKNPSYNDVCSGNTGHVETVKVEYDFKRLPLKKLLEEFFKIIDPTAINKQGNDIGLQYRTGVYYIDEDDEKIIKEMVNKIQKRYSKKIVVEVEALSSFWTGEEYHQRYLDKNPNGYCHVDLSQLPPEEDIFKNEIKKLSPLEYYVTQNNGTEAPFSGEYNENYEKGLYVDIVSGEVLFSSEDKFDSNCGWPSFSKAISDSAILKNIDTSHNMIRTEVKSKIANSHLGHVFDDGPIKLGGKRFCINSSALRFIPYEKLEEEGYGEYTKLFNKK